MTTGDVVYSLRFSLIKILPEPGFDLGLTAGESCVLTARLPMLDQSPRSFTPYHCLNSDMEVKVPGVNFNHQILMEVILNKSSTQRYILRPSINNSMIKCSI